MTTRNLTLFLFAVLLGFICGYILASILLAKPDDEPPPPKDTEPKSADDRIIDSGIEKVAS